MQRVVEDEWLDTLPPADPRAARSRRDLKRVNAIMRNAAIVARALTGAMPRPPRCLVELGAGDGAWLVQLAHALPGTWTRMRAVLLDRQDAVSAGALARLAAHGWQAEVLTADVFDGLLRAGVSGEAVVANLFLHHFEDARLRTLLALVARHARVFVACEPRRASYALQASRLLGLVGCNAVTRHDAVVSVRAGFAGSELSALWPAGPGWRLEEGPRGAFSHLFVGRRVR